MKVTAISRSLHPRHEFRTSRGAGRQAANVFLALEKKGVVGWGEASPISYYNETAETVLRTLLAAEPWISTLEVGSPEDIARIWQDAWPRLAPSRAAQCALDLALWDLLGRKGGVSVCELVWGTKPAPVTSFCTIGLSNEQELAAKIEELRFNPLIKLKSDQHADLSPAERVVRSCAGQISVDANCAWGVKSLQELMPRLQALGVLFVEQPVAPGREAVLGRYPVPLFADESCVEEADVERVGEHYSGFNIKLVKCGGLTPALRMLRRGRELGLQVMVGCMLESSLLIGAAAVVAQQTDYADLDGAWLLKDDPFQGCTLENGILTPSQGSGFGVSWRTFLSR